MSNLAITLRPQTLAEVVGHTDVKRSIQKIVDSGNIPRAFLFSGPTGTGKTTLAEIVARMINPDGEFVVENINGSDKNGVDDARELVERSKNRPLTGRYRVFIIDEAHRMTTAAQDALLIPTEAKESSTIWIFASTEPGKLLPALRSRCSAATFDLKPLRKVDIDALVDAATPLTVEKRGAVVEFLLSRGITSPREILGVLDLHLAGTPLEQCISGAEHEPLYKEIASSVLSGNWTKCAATLEQIKTADYRGMVGIVSAFLAGALLKEPVGARADALATCLVGLGASNYADGVAYAATKGLFYKCAKALGGK